MKRNEHQPHILNGHVVKLAGRAEYLCGFSKQQERWAGLLWPSSHTTDRAFTFIVSAKGASEAKLA